MEDYLKRYEEWFKSGFVEEDNIFEELEDIRDDDDAIKERFNKMLDFGTAGLRGIMRAGLNGMNVYTVRYATQGLADVIKASGEDQGAGVTIAYDSRNNSRVFAREAAMVLAANGIHVNIFDELRPTPELSFAIRETGSIAGINITASHNTREYNGYKAYWRDGAQISPELAKKIKADIDSIHIFDDVKMISYRQASQGGFITSLGKEMDEKYLEAVLEQSVGKKYVDEVGKDLAIVYTPMHGAGHILVPEVLRRLGMGNIITVPEQMEMDGDFPTVESPNPENREAMDMAIELAKEKAADLVIATDPDGDRCAIAVKTPDGFEILSGNQIGCLLLDYIIKARRAAGTLPKNAGAIKSIVSTRMADKICADNGVYLASTLTGFKYIGNKMNEFEETGEHTFIFGFEESIGFLAGTYARDKDAVVASMLISEMACYYNTKGMNLYEAMAALYDEYGNFYEETVSLDLRDKVTPDLDATQIAGAMLDNIRKDMPKEIGITVESVSDYLKNEVIDMKSGEHKPSDLPESNVLVFDLEGGSALAVRPSGTEPKIKLYAMAKGSSEEDAKERKDKIITAGKALIGA